MKQAKSELEISQVMQTLATYISGALRKPLPEAVQEKTKHHVLDTIAAMVSGSRLLPGRKALSFIKTRGGVKEACVVASRFLTTAENAAMANGMFAHVMRLTTRTRRQTCIRAAASYRRPSRWRREKTQRRSIAARGGARLRRRHTAHDVAIRASFARTDTQRTVSVRPSAAPPRRSARRSQL